jgi:hypothetical protein
VLAGFQGPKVSEALIETAKKDASDQVRTAALGSLAFTGGRESLGFLLGILKSRDSSAGMKSKAAAGLQSLSNQDFGLDAGRWARWYEQNQSKLGGP